MCDEFSVHKSYGESALNIDVLSKDPGTFPKEMKSDDHYGFNETTNATSAKSF